MTTYSDPDNPIVHKTALLNRIQNITYDQGEALRYLIDETFGMSLPELR